MRSAKSMATTENHTSVKEVRHSEVLALMLSVVAVILRMVVRVRRAVRSGRNVSGWQGTRKLSMRGTANDPFLLILWAVMRQRCGRDRAPSTAGGSSW